MAKDKIWLSSPHMGGDEIKYVQEAFDTNWIAPVGPHITQFENALANYVGTKHCAALSSGTAAIHLALIVLGIQQDDEVICQSFTFSGSCNPITYCKAKPVFVDSEEETWNMDPQLLRDCIKQRLSATGKMPKAIIVVHLYGMPAKMNEIMAIGREFQIPVIEDAAEALGSEYDGRKAGSIGDFGILSFNGNKIITTSGGGALLSNSEEWIKKARFLATQSREPAPHYEHKEIGYNYRLSNVCAAIGLGQLNVLNDRVEQRRQIFNTYKELLRGTEIAFLNEPKGHFSNRWLTSVLLPSTLLGEKIRLTLETNNIESRPLWKPMHLQPVFSQAVQNTNGISEKFFNKGLCLPSGSNLEANQIKLVCEIIVSQC